MITNSSKESRTMPHILGQHALLQGPTRGVSA